MSRGGIMTREERARRLEAVLKPCPFCGAPVDTCEVEATAAGIHGLKVQCFCGVKIEIDEEPLYSITGGPYLIKTAPDIWNRRAGEKNQEEA